MTAPLHRAACAALLAGLAVCAALAPARAQAPLPPERPPEVTPGAPAVPPPADTAATPVAPLPPERPEELPKTAGPAAPPPEAPDDTACRRRLEKLGVRFEALPPLADGTCGAARPLKVTTVADGVMLTPAATLVCPVAEALARWSTEVRVAAERDLGHAPTAYRSGGSYECRGQNHDPEAKMSEHAHAAAIDVMGFEFSGRPAVAVTAQPEGSPEARFQAAIRAAACTMFSTVLGPGADAEHANHFHLDERERPKGYRICQ